MLGKLDCRAGLLARVLTPDGGGGFSESWSAVTDIWIAVEPASAADSFGPDRLESRARYRVTARRRTDIAAGMRLVIAGRALLIHGLLDDGPRAQFITMLCEDAP